MLQEVLEEAWVEVEYESISSESASVHALSNEETQFFLQEMAIMKGALVSRDFSRMIDDIVLSTICLAASCQHLFLFVGRQVAQATWYCFARHHRTVQGHMAGTVAPRCSIGLWLQMLC